MRYSKYSTVVESIKYIIIIIVLFTVISYLPSTCSGMVNSSAREIDVVGMSVSKACSVLTSEGWAVDMTDETPYSDYSVGGAKSLTLPLSEVEIVGKETVTRVEFEPRKTSSSSQKCHIFFESGKQSYLERNYLSFDVEMWQYQYEDLLNGLANGANPESVGKFAYEYYEEIKNYEQARIPISKISVHLQMAQKYINLIKECGYEIVETDPAATNQVDGIPSGAIKWTEAFAHVGETVTIYGPVEDSEYASSSNGQPTFINLGASYPDENRVTITIWGENRAAFSPSPEEMYEGKTVCVTGEVYLYNNVCNIEVMSPDQIIVLESS